MLAEELGPAVRVLHSGPGEHNRHFLVLEVSGSLDTPDAAVRRLCSLVERLSPRGRAVLNRAAWKVFDVGYELPAGARAVAVALKPETLGRIVALGATVAFTCYRRDNWEPDEMANEPHRTRSNGNRA